ncbi:MAG TPA: hypothetical protein VMS64_38470 [Candidatus Methylomirabilis sp.]|nr:hypothetical protein [Candidatus Methylomirabilis sp.]
MERSFAEEVKPLALLQSGVSSIGGTHAAQVARDARQRNLENESAADLLLAAAAGA